MKAGTRPETASEQFYRIYLTTHSDLDQTELFREHHDRVRRAYAREKMECDDMWKRSAKNSLRQSPQICTNYN